MAEILFRNYILSEQESMICRYFVLRGYDRPTKSLISCLGKYRRMAERPLPGSCCAVGAIRSNGHSRVCNAIESRGATDGATTGTARVQLRHAPDTDPNMTRVVERNILTSKHAVRA